MCQFGSLTFGILGHSPASKSRKYPLNLGMFPLILTVLNWDDNTPNRSCFDMGEHPKIESIKSLTRRLQGTLGLPISS